MKSVTVNYETNLIVFNLTDETTFEVSFEFDDTVIFRIFYNSLFNDDPPVRQLVAEYVKYTRTGFFHINDGRSIIGINELISNFDAISDFLKIVYSNLQRMNIFKINLFVSFVVFIEFLENNKNAITNKKIERYV